MSPTLKKGLKIAGIVLAVLVCAMVILPLAFSGKVNELIQKQADRSLNAKMRYESLRLNLFTNFPKVTVSMNGLTVVGVDSFAHDTLVNAGSVQLAVDLSSLFTDQGYRVSRVALSDAKIYLKQLASGQGNWDIVKPDSAVQKTSPGDTSTLHFKVDRIRVTDCNVTYDDRKHTLLAVCEG